MSQNGKGSKRRIGKPGAYAEGWDRIFGARKAKTGRTLIADGEGAKWIIPSYEEVMGKPGEWHRLIEGGTVEELTTTERRTLDKMVKRHAPTCGGEDGCTNPPDEEHSCPYQEEINGNHEFTCTCCADCRTACAWAI